MWGYVHVSAGAHRDQERTSYLLELGIMWL